jgi:hypothetical protein
MFDYNWPCPPNTSDPIWHNSNNYSQITKSVKHLLKIINKNVKIKVVRIAQFDTGYIKNHKCINYNVIRKDLEKNFVENNNDAIDPCNLKGNSGHGTGTLSILNGVYFINGKNTNLGLNDNLNIEIVPIRISNSVVLNKNKSFEKALKYIISLYDDENTRCQIITMSMGGVASKEWAHLINIAYEKGIFIVSAAGNNLGKLTPRTTVFPARFKRVVSAVGVCYNLTPYFDNRHIGNIQVMQGNYGPREIMKTAIAAFTPNMPWANFEDLNDMRFDGAGTSSATPQIALAAALYYKKYYDIIENSNEGWEKVELIRYALFNSAEKIINREKDINLYFGNGILKTFDMLKIKPNNKKIIKETEDKVTLPIISLILEILTAEEKYNIIPSEEELINLTNYIITTNEILELTDNEEITKEKLKSNPKIAIEIINIFKSQLNIE